MLALQDWWGWLPSAWGVPALRCRVRLSKLRLVDGLDSEPAYWNLQSSGCSPWKQQGEGGLEIRTCLWSVRQRAPASTSQGDSEGCSPFLPGLRARLWPPIRTVLHHSRVAGGETIQHLVPSSAPPGCGCLWSFSASFPSSSSSHPLAAVLPRLWSSFLTPPPQGGADSVGLCSPGLFSEPLRSCLRPEPLWKDI